MGFNSGFKGLMWRLSWNLGASSSWNPQGLSRPLSGLLYLYCSNRSLRRAFRTSPDTKQEFITQICRNLKVNERTNCNFILRKEVSVKFTGKTLTDRKSQWGLQCRNETASSGTQWIFFKVGCLSLLDKIWKPAQIISTSHNDMTSGTKKANDWN